MAPSRKDTKVVVVGGGGTMGSSTALHLLRSGYTPSNITVLDVYPIPSAQSAGNDLNKIMGIRLRNKVDLQLSLEAREMWRNDELFKPFFHNTGRVSNLLFILPRDKMVYPIMRLTADIKNSLIARILKTAWRISDKHTKHF
jgi:hypothetical protein